MASLIMLFLKKQGWLEDHNEFEWVPGQELTVIMDNCPRQNQNNSVLRLTLLLVKAGYFQKVNCMFYSIVGHMKSICDRWLNTLKKKYRTKQYRQSILEVPYMILNGTRVGRHGMKLKILLFCFVALYYLLLLRYIIATCTI